MQRENSEILSTAKWIALALVAGYVSIKALEKWDGKLPPLVGGCDRRGIRP
jgi:hypothetical protein